MITLLVYIALIVVICAVAVWVIGQLAPGHPVIVDRLIWVFCVLLVLIVLLKALGVQDVDVPRL